MKMAAAFRLQRSEWILTTILLASTISLCGCGETQDFGDVYPVRGKLLVDGEPAEGAYVTFLPAADAGNPRARRSTGVVKADGSFELTTFMTHDGAPAGEYVVTAYWPGPLPKNSHPTEVGPDKLGGRFNKPSQPLARVTIEEQENALEPFRVEGGRR